MVGGVGDVDGVIGAHGEEQRVAIHQVRAEAAIHAGLVRKMAIEVFRCVERVVGFRDVAGERGGENAGLIPIASAQGVGELGAIDADLPGQNAGGLELSAAELGHGGLVSARQSFQGELAVMVHKQDVIGPKGVLSLFAANRANRRRGR